MEKKFFGYKACIGVFLYALVNMGSGLSFSLFLNDFAERCSVDIGTTMYFYSVGTAIAVVATLLFPKVVQKWGLRNACIIGTIADTIAFVIIALARNIILLYAAAVVYGINVAFGLAAPVSIAVGQWFVDKRNQMLGIGTAFMSLGGVIILAMSSYVIQSIGTTAALYMIAGVVFVVGVVAEIFLIKEPHEVGQKALGWEKEVESGNDGEKKIGLTMKQALKTPAFWIVILATVILYLAYEGIASYGPTYYQEYGISFSMASIMAIVLQILVLLGGFIGGWVGDHWGLKVQIIMFFGFLAIGLLCLFVWSSSPLMVLVWAAVGIGGLGEASFGFVPPGVCLPLFGAKDYDNIVSAVTAAGFLGSFLSAFVMNLAISLGGMYLFYVITGVLVIAIGIALLIALAHPPLKECKK